MATATRSKLRYSAREVRDLIMDSDSDTPVQDSSESSDEEDMMDVSSLATTVHNDLSVV